MSTQQTIFRKLKELIAGSRFEGQVYAAGGCVRDMILDRESKDIDVVVTLPNGGIELAEWIEKEHGGSKVVIFQRFGTAKFVWQGIDLEAVIPRKEVYADDTRNPEVAFATLSEDAQRRDFTVNALYWDISKERLLDFVHGRADIALGVIRTAINPEIIFKDDPLRMLRAIRFSQRFRWAIEHDLLIAIQFNCAEIERISQERVTMELNEILTSEDPAAGIELLRLSGLLPYVLPEIFELRGVGQNQFHDMDVYGHTLKVMGFSPRSLEAQLAAMFHDVGKPATRIAMEGEVHFPKHEEVGAELADVALRRMKYPNSVVETVTVLVREHMRIKNAGKQGENITDKALRKLRADLDERLPLLLDLLHADNQSHAPAYCMPEQIPGILVRYATLAAPTPKIVLPIDGNDIMQHLELPPGKIIGQLLAVVKDAYFSNPFLTRDEAFELVRVKYSNTDWLNA